jgi:hypothetical protein
MKITDTTNPEFKDVFSELKINDFFKRCDNHICVKTGPYNYYNITSAVFLTITKPLEYMVRLVDAELIIRPHDEKSND